MQYPASAPEVEDKVGHWLTVTSSNGSGEHVGELPGKQSVPTNMSHKRQRSLDLLADESVIHKSNHIEVDFQDGPTRFYCKVRESW